MPEIVLSQYQKNIIDYYKSHPDENIMVNALAGVGKSFILCQLLEMSKTSDIYLAFNSSIAEEFRHKIKNPKVKIYTSHSLGLSIMNSNLSGSKSGGIGISRGKDSEKAVLDNLKVHKSVDDMITSTYGRRFNWDERNFLKNNYVTLYNLARVTQSLEDREKIERLVEEHGLFFDVEGNFHRPDNSVICSWIWDIDKESLDQFESDRIIDFTDMIYITVKKLAEKEWNVPFYNLYTNIAVDEAQDINRLTFAFIRFIKRKGGRYVFVLDKNQAIYGFNGGNANSYNDIPKMFSPVKEFDLPINYRCPTSHLDYVNQTFSIPIKARPDAPEGEIIHIEKREVKEYVQPGDMVISRKNKWFAPLLVELAVSGIPVYIEDKDMVESIRKLIKGQKVVGCTGLKHKLEETMQNYRKKISSIIKDTQDVDSMVDTTEASTRISVINDKVDNIDFVLQLLNPYMEKNPNPTVEQFLTYLNRILNTIPSNECVRICSVHKAKGLEAPNVFVLNEAKVCTTFNMPREQKEQEINLSYISVTRAMDTLYLVTEEDA